MSGFKKGDYVICVDANGDGDYGRVASVRADKVFVCFTTGCTTAACVPSDLSAVAPRAWMLATPFGHHRFDASCPEYDPECCAAYCPEKGGE